MSKLFKINSSKNVYYSQPLSVATPIGSVILEVNFNGKQLSKQHGVAQEVSDNCFVYIWDFPDFHIELLKTDIAPSLPPGMYVTHCIAFLWRFITLSQKMDLRFTCRLSPIGTISGGDIESGEGLASQSWQSENTKLSMGTEDEDYLFQRAENNQGLPLRFASEMQIDPETIEYLRDGIAISLPPILENEAGQVQFVVSWVEGKTKDTAATWFAVDISPEKILKAVGISS